MASHVAADFPRLLAHLDQPSIDGVNTFYVSRAVAQTGIKAVLSGAGGDELFGGYPSFTRLPRAMMAKRIAGKAWPVASALGGLMIPRRLRARWRHFAETNGSLVEAYRVQRGFLMPEEIDALAGSRAARRERHARRHRRPLRRRRAPARAGGRRIHDGVDCPAREPVVS